MVWNIFENCIVDEYWYICIDISSESFAKFHCASRQMFSRTFDWEYSVSKWRNQMVKFSALLALCARNHIDKCKFVINTILHVIFHGNPHKIMTCSLAKTLLNVLVTLSPLSGSTEKEDVWFYTRCGFSRINETEIEICGILPSAKQHPSKWFQVC